MPWKEINLMDERLKFVARLLDGERMTTVCKEFGISRKTGYKIFNRYKDVGLDGLKDRNRRPQRQANRMPFQVERSILQLKRVLLHDSSPTVKVYLTQRVNQRGTIEGGPIRASDSARRNLWRPRVPALLFSWNSIVLPE